MAKIKIKGLQDFLVVSGETAKEVDRIWKDESIDRSFKLSIGNASVTKGDITMVFMDPEDANEKSRMQEEYMKDRKKKLEWTIEQRVAYQEKYFELFKCLTGISENFLDFKDDITKYLTEHPNRLWCDPRIWSNSKEDSKVLDLYEQGALKVIFMVDANERNEERSLEEEKKVLSVFGR